MKTHQLKCCICAGYLQKPPSRFKRSKNHYCSRECCYEGKIGKKLGPASEDRKRKIRIANFKSILLPCPRCKKEIFVAPCKLNYRRYCSYKCYIEYVKTRSKEGYIFLFLPNHPNAKRSGLIAEHRKVASEILGRKLKKGETIHHINNIKNDNRPENLYLFTSLGSHIKYHQKIRHGLCKEITKSNLEIIAKFEGANRHELIG